MPKTPSLLLDFYPNAAAAYSVRKLRTAYSGNCIQVRRSSDNTTQDIGFVNNVLDTASLLSFVGAGNGFVPIWYDQSGNGNNITQSTSTSQPQIVSSGSLLVDNGIPKIQFDGTNDFLNGGDILKAGNNSLCSFVVAQMQNNNTLYAKSLLGPTVSRYALLNDTNQSVSLIHLLNGGPFNATTTAAFTKRLFNQEFIANTTNRLYLNNSLSASVAATGVIGNSTYQFLVGKYNDGSGGSTGNIYVQNGFTQELIIYLSDQSSNRSAINTNINSFYSIY